MLLTPHLEKLRALLENEKLPEPDRPRIEDAMSRYRVWIESLQAVSGEMGEIIAGMVGLLNEYRKFLDIDVIFDSEEDFLYRQKGQLKLDNTVIEEFLPHLLARVFPQLREGGFHLGPSSCFSALSFASTLAAQSSGGGPIVRTKDQDFAIARHLTIRTAHEHNRSDEEVREARLGYVCAECKTNLDKTMFQEASATAHDLKTALPGSKYYLLCEWLDMTPLNTAATDIDEVLIFRKARRLGAQVRRNFGSVAGRKAARGEYKAYLEAHPFDTGVFDRLVDHIREVLEHQDLEEGNVLEKGFF